MRMGPKHAFNGQIDVTRYVFCCLLCRWTVQAGYRARSDVGGAQALLDAFTVAHYEHIAEAHPDGAPADAERLEWEDGTTHELAGKNQGALIAERLPEWWVDHG